MKFVLLTNVVSPHMLPIASELANRFGADNFRYLAIDHISELRKKIGWADESVYPWVVIKPANESYTAFVGRHNVCAADIVLTNIRDVHLIRQRASRGLKTYFSFERWFRPPYGMWRLLHPCFLRMAWGLGKELQLGHVIGLGIGLWAIRDMARLCGLISGDVRCLLRPPSVVADARPGGIVVSRRTGDVSPSRYAFDNMRVWAYFVGKDTSPCNSNPPEHKQVSLLWVGRMLRCKRVETIVKAVSKINRQMGRTSMRLDIYGTGPDEKRLRSMCAEDWVVFHPPVDGKHVRALMRSHDVYVFSSDATDGWGVVVNEALLEGMCVLGTYEAGASATLLPEDSLFHAGDTDALSGILFRLVSDSVELERRKQLSSIIIDKWLPTCGADYLVDDMYG